MSSIGISSAMLHPPCSRPAAPSLAVRAGGHGRCPSLDEEQRLRTPSTADPAPPPKDEDERPAGGKARRRGDHPADQSGKTLPEVEGQSAPRMPHERDESSDSGTGAPSEVVRRGHDDIASGKTGTDKGEATDAVYRRSLRDSTPGKERD
jgi:hypothetical protein